MPRSTSILSKQSATVNARGRSAPTCSPELLDRRQIWQRRRVAEEVVEGDESMGLAAAVGELELAHRLVALSCEPRRDVLDELPQRVGRIGEREELLRVLVYRAAALRERHFVQVGRELCEGELPRAQLLFQADDVMPGLGLVPRSHRTRLKRQAISRLRSVAGRSRR